MIKKIVISGLLTLALGLIAAFLVIRHNSERIQAQAILGVSLPADARDVKVWIQPQDNGGDYFVSAQISHEAFLALVNQVQLAPTPDVLKTWPEALSGPAGWNPSNGSEFYFTERKKEFSLLMAAYDKDRFFFKRHVYPVAKAGQVK